MSDTLNEQLEKLKERLLKWNGQLTGFKQWALANDGILDETEKSLIALLEKEINAINQRILQVEKAKSNANSSQSTGSSKNITASVGKGGTNKKEDVTLVQQLLNSKNKAGLDADGDCGNKTIAAIEAFQQKTFGWKDGLISTAGKTWTALSGAAASNNNSNTNTNNSNTNNNSNNTVPAVEGSTGIGDEGDETYKNQRDNPVLGDVTCNVTTLAMQLLGLANGDEAKVIQSALALCKKHNVGGVSVSTQLEEILRKLTIVAAGNKEKIDNIPVWQWSWVLDKTAELFTDLVDHVDDAGKFWEITSKEKYFEKIVPALKDGAEVMLSNKLTSGGHIAFLVSVRDEGIVINDPYGIMVTGHQYLRNAELINSTKKSLISSNQAVFDNRLKLNSGLKSKINQLLASGANFPSNSGEKNFYSWDEVKTYQIGKWCNVAYKKK
jgi:peptidoglycan hydrolase-like protein with peptidoglycan-binding domain